MDDRTAWGARIYAASIGVDEAELLPAFSHRAGEVYAHEAILLRGYGLERSRPARPRPKHRLPTALAAVRMRRIAGHL